MRSLSFSSLGVSAAASALLLVGPFLAGNPAAIAPTLTFEGIPAAEIDEQELEAFAEAYVVVAEVHQRVALGSDRYLADPEGLLAFMEAGEAEATEAIEESGLTRQRFQEILSALASDDGLREQAIERIARVRGEHQSSAAAAGPFDPRPRPDA